MQPPRRGVVFSLFAEQAEGPGVPAYSTKVSLSLFYSGGLNEGFGWPGRGESRRLPTEPLFFPGIKASCFLPVEKAQPVQTTQDADVLNKSSRCHLLSGALGVLGLGWGQAQVLLPAPTEIARSPQISLSARPALEGSNPRVGRK